MLGPRAGARANARPRCASAPLARRGPAAARLFLPTRKFRLTETLCIALALLARTRRTLALACIRRRGADPGIGGRRRGTPHPSARIALGARRGVTVRGRDRGRLPLDPVALDLVALDPGPGEIRTSQSRDPVAELITQGPRFHLFDCAFRQIAESERTERNPDQAVHRQPEMTEHVLHLTVLAFPDCEGEPDVAALRAVDGGLDLTISHAIDGAAAPQRIQLRPR